MPRLLLTFFAGLLFAAMAYSAEPKEWTTFEEPDGRFKIALPTKLTTKERWAGRGKKKTVYIGKSDELDCRFEVGVTERSTLEKGETIEKYYAKIVADIGEAEEVKSYDSTQFQWKEKYPALEMTIQAKFDTKEQYLQKYYIVATTQHEIMIVISGPKKALEGQQIADCFESLTIKE